MPTTTAIEPGLAKDERRRREAAATSLDNWRARATLSVPEAGRAAFELGRNASYAAAARGEIPTIRLGSKIRVPVIQLRRLLGEVA